MSNYLKCVSNEKLERLQQELEKITKNKGKNGKSLNKIYPPPDPISNIDSQPSNALLQQ